jgi:hypothetical protein
MLCDPSPACLSCPSVGMLHDQSPALLYCSSVDLLHYLSPALPFLSICRPDACYISCHAFTVHLSASLVERQEKINKKYFTFGEETKVFSEIKTKLSFYWK